MECRLQAFKNDFAYGQAAVIRVNPFNNIPRRVVPAGTTNDALAKPDNPVIGFRLLPIQRTDAPAVERIVLKSFETSFHLLLGQMKPKLENHRAFITQHFFQAFRAVDRLIKHRILEDTVNPTLQHLAVPIAEKHAHAPFGR